MGKKRFQQRSFLPDPILRLKGVIGFGGHSTKWALWTPDGAAVVYPCHAVVVVLHVETREQRLFLGHTDKVSALALDGSSSLLASAQARPHSMLRLWDFQTGSCLALFRSPVHTISSLSFSNNGELLCGVGKDRHGRTVTGPAGRWGSRPRVQAGGRDPRWPPPAWPGTPTSHAPQGISFALVDGAVFRVTGLALFAGEFCRPETDVFSRQCL